MGGYNFSYLPSIQGLGRLEENDKQRTEKTIEKNAGPWYLKAWRFRLLPLFKLKQRREGERGI